ncbi:MAG: MFS transporter [Bacteroidota bacterium]
MKKETRLGLKENLPQFILLVIVNAFVGGMVGLERSVLPQLAEEEFHIAAKTILLSFIVVFGITKAITNYFTGTLAHRFGRKNLLVAGWLFAIPVPLILMYAENWNYIVAANILLGIHQGLSWSATVMMKIDLVGEKQRGFAMGLNEFAGYIAVAVVAFLTGYIAGEYGVRPYPFYTGIALVAAGLFFSLFLIKDTRHHVSKEAETSAVPRMKNIFWETSWKDKNLGTITVSGLVNNLNDGMMWGILPVLLMEQHFSPAETGIIAAIYPAVWGVGQIFTGKMSDFFCKKSLLSWGMWLQGLSLVYLFFAQSFFEYVMMAVLLGWGTALVYPTFLAAIAENTHPHDRSKSLGTFRFWRDLGYAIGALLTGVLADIFGTGEAVLSVALVTIAAAVLIEKRMYCRVHSIKIWEWINHKFIGKSNDKGRTHCRKITITE